jgi:hypothetical protein
MTGQLPRYDPDVMRNRRGAGSPLLPVMTPSTLVPHLSDAQHSQDLPYRDRAVPKGGDADYATVSLAPGRWPRVFPGL